MTQQQQPETRKIIGTTNKQPLNQQEKSILAEITTQIENQQKQSSKYIKFSAGETKKLLFFPERTRSTLVTFREGEKPTQRFAFYAYDLDRYSDSLSSQEEPLEFTVGPKLAKDIIKYLSKGYRVLSITRHGSDLSTEYDVDSIEE
jgi:hypothetical protein